MKKINSETGLQDAILLLESKQADEGKILREQFYLTLDSLKPVNLIKSTFKEAVASKELTDNILNSSLGLAAGFISKLIFQGLTKSPVKRLVGTALMFGITNVVAKNPEAVKSLGKSIINIVRSKSGKHVHEKKNSQQCQVEQP
jgi:hypothetical protein